MTLEKIRAALPTHIPLPQGAKLKSGDVIWQHTSRVTGVWKAAFVEGCVNSRPFRRPIPTHILDNQAWWALYDKCATVSPNGKGYILLPKFGGIVPSFVVDCFGERKFTDDEHAYQAVIHLGGDKEVIKRLTEGRLYDKWLLEQMEGI